MCTRTGRVRRREESERTPHYDTLRVNYTGKTWNICTFIGCFVLLEVLNWLFRYTEGGVGLKIRERSVLLWLPL